MTWQASAAALAALLFLFAVPMGAADELSNPPAVAPVNPHASPEARALLRYLCSISGRYTITGQHNYPNHIARWTDRAYDFTGKYPGLYGEDFGFSAGDDKDSILARPAMIKEIERQYRNGAVITLTWHAVRPADDEPVTFRDSVQGHLSDFEWNELLTPGTRLYQRWCAQVDAAAASLNQLQDAGVPVLWQPYPEPNGNKFWWAGRKGTRGSAALYRQLFDRLVNHHGLRNLIWVWDAASPGFVPDAPGQYSDFFPGLAYVDALAVNLEDFNPRWRSDTFLALVGVGKVIGVGLTGRIPDPSFFTQQTGWAWFLVSSDDASVPVPARSEVLCRLYADPRVLTRAAETGPQPSADSKLRRIISYERGSPCERSDF